MHKHVERPARSGRVRRAAVAVALVATGIGTAVVATYASAATEPSVSDVTANAPKNAVLRHYQIPANAQKATHALPKPGKYGDKFQVRTAPSAPGVYVVGGTPVNSADYPGVVGIETNFLAMDENDEVQWYTAVCTGTVLSATKVLTAGHCTVGYPFGYTVVIAGRNNLDNDAGGFVARVASTWTDPRFNVADLNAGRADVPLNDVSVLTLQQALPAEYKPVTLTAQGDQAPYAAGTNATVVGYGLTDSADNNSVGTLYAATVPVQGDAVCSTAMPGYDGTRMVCAGTPAGGVGACRGDSGGPLFVAGSQAGITDWGAADCETSGAYAVYERLSYYADVVKADLTRTTLVNLDWSGDGHSDLMARDSAGTLVEYSGSGFADDGYDGFAGSAELGSGWNAYKKLFRTTNWNGDGTESIFAMTSTGLLYQYAGDGIGGFATGQGVQIGNGWNSFADIMVVTNWTGDGHPNLLGRTPTGDLYLYTSDGKGGWMNNGVGVKIGNGWNSFNTVLTPGIWAGDGHQALIGRTPTGDLYLYKSDGHGGWMNNGVGVKIGNGWNSFTIFMSPGDWSGDSIVDLLGVNPSGEMYLYRTDGFGGWQNNGVGELINTGWNGFTAIF